MTYANTQVNVGGTSTFDIGRDLNIKGGVINTGSAQGRIRGDVNIESLQDTATYNSKQKNIGVNADIALKGAGSSLSINGGKTNINADHKAVGQQSGIFTKDGGIDLTVDGKTTLIGGAITTTEAAQQAGRNNYTSLGGITTQDIENTSRYKGDAIQAGISIGNTAGKPQANMNGLGYGTDSDNQTSITRSGITGIAGNSGITTDNRAEYAGILENSFDANRINEELAAQTQITQDFGKEAPKAVAEFSQNRINAIKADPSLSVNEKLVAIGKWDEGGVYRVAAHTALGALGTGSLEGALTTGGVAAAAPTLDKVQEKIAESLIASGMSEDIANGTASGVISLTLLGAGTAAGLDTSSTVTAVNVDANNRQLHPQEADLIKILALEYARKHGISIEEAEKRLTRGALYNIDAGWKDSIDTYIDDKEIESYQEAFNYINQVKPSDLNAYDWADKIRPEHIKAEMAAELAAYEAEIAAEAAAAKQYDNEDGSSLPSTTLNTITVTAKRDPKYTYYIDTKNNSFTATEKDFNNEEVFLVDTLGGNTNPNSDDYNEAKLLMDNSAAIKPSKVSFFEGIGRDIRSGKGTVVGFSRGVATGITDTVKAIFSGAEKVAKTTEDLINDPQRTIESGVNTVGTLIGNAPEIAQKGFDQLEDASKLSNAKLNLYDLQQNSGAKSEYEANIAGQIVGGGGVGSAGKQAVKKIDDVASEIGKGLDGMTPKPATVIGTPDTDGATTITGRPDGNKFGAAETGGAILAIGDAKEGTYTYNSDGSVTGSGGGRATSTGKRDDNGNEIYQRESGGYYVIDDKGIQRTTASPNVRPVANNTGYNRPYLRQQTIQNIEANYTNPSSG